MVVSKINGSLYIFLAKHSAEVILVYRKCRFKYINSFVK